MKRDIPIAWAFIIVLIGIGGCMQACEQADLTNRVTAIEEAVAANRKTRRAD